MKDIFGTPRITYRKVGGGFQLVNPAVFVVQIFPEKDIETEFIRLSTKGLLELSVGYWWGGPTGAKPTRDSLRGTAVHDALYRLFRLGLLDLEWKPLVDEILRRLCIQDGMDEGKAKAWEWFTNRFGFMFCKKPSDEDYDNIYVAP